MAKRWQIKDNGDILYNGEIMEYDHKSVTFTQNIPPTEYVLGDTWYDPVDTIMSRAVIVSGKLRWIGV